MRPPLSRDRPSLRADCAHCFRWASSQASSASGHVFRRHCWLLVHQRDGTTPFVRVERHRDGGYSASWHGSLCPSNVSVPAYRPPYTRGCPSGCTSAAQVRGRGSPRSPAGTFALWTGARADVSAHARGQGNAPLGAGAFGDAHGGSWPRTVARQRPACPREAAGSPAPLPARWRKGSRSHTPLRCHRSETARASGGAKTVKAGPFPCCVAQRARDLGPAGWVRRQRTAAAEQAHVREAGPLCVPAGPDRGPADALAPVTRRQADTPSGTRGKRTRSCLADQNTRRRIVPRPGTVWRQARVGAAGGLAVCTRASARHHRRGGRGPPRRFCGPQARHTAPRPPADGSGTRSCCRSRASGPGGWLAGQASTAQRVAACAVSGA